MCALFKAYVRRLMLLRSTRLTQRESTFAVHPVSLGQNFCMCFTDLMSMEGVDSTHAP